MVEANTDRIEQSIEIKATPARVWRALTDYREFGAWFGAQLEGPFVPGKTTRGRITHPGYEHLVMELVVQTMDPERCFSLHWHPYAVDANVDYSGEPPTLVEFTLEKTATGTRLTVIESGFDSLPPERRDLAFRMNSQGWAIQVERVANHVTSAP